MIGKTRWAGFRSILCPVDFSKPSQSALRYAVAIAVRGNATLRVLYVNDPFLVASASAALHDRDVVKRSEGELEALIIKTVPARARARLRVTSRALAGRVPEEILNEARRRKCDLIVMGTHGRSGADRLLMGSTTLSVLLRTKVPVLAVPHSRR
jgi:nucleotide-binding universal stress UspA family protein